MDYNTHFESALYEHNFTKNKAKERRKREKRRKKKEFRMVKEGQQPTFYIEDEKPIYKPYFVEIPAYYEEEKYLVRVKNGEFLYFEDDGTPVYIDSFRYVNTGRLIYHPAKKVKRHKYIGTQPCVPYIKHYSLSKRKRFAKKMTNRTIRRNHKLEAYREKAGYQRTYDYAWNVW